MQINLGEPNIRQQVFLEVKQKYVCYGGSRGGGKSWSIRTKSKLLGFNPKYPGIRMLILRRTYKELMHNHIIPLCSELNGICTYNKTDHILKFPDGSIIVFGYLQYDSDIDQYQGQEYDIIFVDEATQISEISFLKLKACLRGANRYPKRMYLTCNPGGKGHAWVKRLFVDRKYKDGEREEEYVFIKAQAYDNKVLLEMQPDYIEQLQALPDKLRKAWLDGDWDIFEGQFFEEFVDSPEHYHDRIYTHVIEPFEIPRHWKIYRSFDFGYAKPFSVGWWAVDEEGILYRILELYGCTKDANTGVKWEPNKIFQEIKKIENEHRWLKGKKIFGPADPSIWDASRGIAVNEEAIKNGIYFEKGDNARIPGWMQIHYRLAFDENGIPMMYIFKNCKGFIRTIPLLQYDEVKPEDLDTDGEDHIADETRYMCMARPIKARKTIEVKPIYDTPLNDKTMYGVYY